MSFRGAGPYAFRWRPESEGRADQRIYAPSPRPRHHQPEQYEHIEHFVHFGEVVYACDILYFDLHDRHEHVERQRDRYQPREQSEHQQNAADPLRVTRERCAEVRLLNTPTDKPLREGVEVMDLAPAGFGPKIAEIDPHQERRQPIK